MTQSVFDFLDELHIQYEKLEHPPILTMEEGKEVGLTFYPEDIHVMRKMG